MSLSLETLAGAGIVDKDVEELTRPQRDTLVTNRTSSNTDHAQKLPFPNSGRFAKRGNPDSRVDNIHFDGDAKVHTGNNYYEQKTGGEGSSFQISGDARVHIDATAFRDAFVNYQVSDGAELIIGPRSSFMRPGTADNDHNSVPSPGFGLQSTYGSVGLSFEATAVHLRRHKLAYQAGKVTDTSPYVAHPNTLYPELRSPRIKTEFAHIARNFQLLDEQFALYFRSIVSSKLDREDLSHLLRNARIAVCKVQFELKEDCDVVLGDLGQFCEDVAHKASEDVPEFRSTDGSVEARLRYLQDAYLDVPYWSFILDFFANEQSKAKELMTRIMSHIKLDSINRRAVLLESAATWTVLEVEDMKKLGPILNGIHARLECLDNIYHSHALDLETSPLLNTLLQTRSLEFCYPRVNSANKVTDQDVAASAHQGQSDPAPAAPPVVVVEMQDKSNEVSINIGLFALIVIPSFLFGAMAFHISMASNEPGTFRDADFWNLLQSTVISIFGSLALAIGFFLHARKTITHWSTTYIMACLIWVVGFICAIVSVAIYTLVNTAWSSMMSTFSSVLALLAPLLLMLASLPQAGSAARSVKAGKQKAE